MKHLILAFIFTLSNIAAAQHKVEIKNLDGVVTHGGERDTIEEINTWVAEQESSNSWGKPERLVPTSECTEDELANQVLETIPAIGEEGEIDYVPEMKRLKKTYVVGPIIDVSEQRNLEKKIQESQEEIRKGRYIIAKFKALNKLKDLSNAQKKAIRDNATIKQVIEALEVGDLADAKTLIQSITPDGILITEDDKNKVLEDLP